MFFIRDGASPTDALGVDVITVNKNDDSSLLDLLTFLVRTMEEIIKLTHEDDMISEIVKLYPDLDERKKVINTPKYGWVTILTYALMSKYPKAKFVRFLLENGADPNWMTDSGYHTMAYRSHDRISAPIDNIMLLLAYGADPNRTGQSHSVLYQYTMDPCEPIVHLLLLHNAQMTTRELESLRKVDDCRIKIIENFYVVVTLRSMALHRIRLNQLRHQ